MPDTPNLRPGTRDEIPQSRSCTLRFNARKRVHDADDTIARITPEQLGNTPRTPARARGETSLAASLADVSSRLSSATSREHRDDGYDAARQ